MMLGANRNSIQIHEIGTLILRDASIFNKFVENAQLHNAVVER